MELPGESQAAGFLLCRVGPHRLAIRAGEVTVIEAHPSGTPELASHAFEREGSPGRYLRGPSGMCLAVDQVEVSGEPLPLLPVPAMLQRLAGGALAAFIVFEQQVLPVVRLEELGRYLAHRRKKA